MKHLKKFNESSEFELVKEYIPILKQYLSDIMMKIERIF